MMRRFILIGLILMTSPVYANWFQDIINTINKQSGITNNLLGNLASQEGQILSTQQDIDSLMKELNGHMAGHSGWGSYQFHDYQSYGDNARDWTQLLQMAERGQGLGDLGSMMTTLSQQFPSDISRFNQGIADVKMQRYYALKSQSNLAVRAASQLDYNNIQDQITYQKMLQQQIEKASDLKAAMDLSNRIQVENNLIQLEILRQVALMNQQQIITDQAVINSALSHANFLTKP